MIPHALYFRLTAGVRHLGQRRSGWIWLVIVSAAASGCGRSEPAGPAKLTLLPGEYALSADCGSCHRDIHAGWASSVHATAGQDVLFRQAFEEAASVDRKQAEALCNRCHSPALAYGAKNVTPEVSQAEGVGCDFCHSISGVDLKRRDNPYTVEFGPVKRGPIKDAASMAHLVEYSDLHVNSQMCAGCHEYSTENGTPVLSTYSEWQSSSYARDGVNCQRCHMPYVLADVVDPKVKRIGGVAVNLHQIPGGHSRQMMYKALNAGISSVSREKGKIRVAVSVSNTGAGHTVPTGMPTRKILLTVEVTSEKGQQQRQEIVYERVVLNAEGQVVDRDSELFTKAAGIKSDNRLRPGDKRGEQFEFTDLPGENVTVQARLSYLYSPHSRKETEVRFDFFNEEKHLVAQFTRKP